MSFKSLVHCDFGSKKPTILGSVELCSWSGKDVGLHSIFHGTGSRRAVGSKDVTGTTAGGFQDPANGQKKTLV